MAIEREKLEADVLIVGAGPAGLACALHLAQPDRAAHRLRRNRRRFRPKISTCSKRRAKSARINFPAPSWTRARFANSFPISRKPRRSIRPSRATPPITSRESSSYKLPITPPPLRNHGNYVISLNKLVKWLGGLVEKKGVNVFTQFAGRELIYEKNGIAGVITEDKGVDKNGKPKDNFTPGYELRAKVTVLAEGPRGSLTKDLVNALKLDGLNPQVYGIGIKELWDVQPGRIATGYVAHTLGWPLDSRLYGGGWIYGLRDNRVSLGMVVGLEYHNPLFDPHEAFQKFKTHPFVKQNSRRRQTRPLRREDGSLRRLVFDAAQLRGRRADRRRFREPAEFAAAQGHPHGHQERNARRGNDLRSAVRRRYLRSKLSAYPQKIEQSWLKKELWAVRNFHQGFHDGLWTGLVHAGLQFVTGGRGLVDPMRCEAGYKEYDKLNRDRTLVDQSTRFKGDGKLTFDRLTDVYHSGTRHEEDQPCHLHRPRAEYLRRPLRERIRQSLPVFLPRGRLRNG